MHLLEKYSLNCGINPNKLGKAEIYSSYYPIPHEKYVVFHASSGMPSKNYSYYQDIIDFIEPTLSANGFGIVQIGGKDDKSLNKCTNLHGITNIHQTAFILKNCSLLIANDSFSTHVCSSFGVPLVSLYSIIQPQVAGPYWNNGKQFTIMAPLGGNKPKYSNIDPDRIIDKIKPEDVLDQIKKALPDLNWNNLNISKTILIGKSYPSQQIDFVPDLVVKIGVPNEFPFNIRFDYLKNKNISEENLYSALVNIENRPFSITTSQPIDLSKVINQNNIKNFKSLIFSIEKEYIKLIDKHIEFIKMLKNKGARVDIVIEKNNFSKKELDDLKFKFLDIQPINEIITTSWEDGDINGKIQELTDLTVFKSSRIIYSNGKSFLTKQSMLEGKPSSSNTQRIKEINNIKNLGKEIDSLFIFNP